MSTDWPEDVAFDPETGELLDEPPAQANVMELSVSELSMALKRTLEDTYGYVRVRGELGRVSRPASGHVYLDLKDDRAVLSGVIWKGVASRLRIQPEQGLEVIVSGKITTFPGQSRYQIVIDTLEPAGAGALMALLEERRQKLQSEGLFDDARKKPIPFLPEVIGVVTSPTGAVIRDILHRLSDRFPRRVLVWPVRVQGEASATEVANGIRGFNALQPGDPQLPRPDLIIVARGGGSLEDLWGFNEEIVARAAAASEIPLISAVGHETDWTLIDHAADWRAPTPTAAAERAVPVRSELIGQTGALGLRLQRASLRLIAERRARVTGAARGLPRPDEILGLARQRFDSGAGRLGLALRASTQIYRARFDKTLGRMSPRLLHTQTRHANDRLQVIDGRLAHALKTSTRQFRARYDRLSGHLSARALARQLSQGRDQLAGDAARLERGFIRTTRHQRQALTAADNLLQALSYQSVLQRGFALVSNSSGTLVRQATELNPGEDISLQFADGTVDATVGRAASGRAPASSKPRKPGSPGGQGSLF